MLAAKRALKALVKTSFVRMMFAKGHVKEEIRAIFEFIGGRPSASARRPAGWRRR